MVFGGEAPLDRTEASSSRRKKGGRGRRKGRRKKMNSEIDKVGPAKIVANGARNGNLNPRM